MKYFHILLVLMLTSIAPAFGKTSPSLLSKVKNAIVLLEVAGELGAYHVPSAWAGSGFVVDAKRGIIVTNQHLAPSDVSARYRLTFQGGEKIDATFLYADPWQDFAFLKVDPQDLPKSAEPLAFSTMSPQMDGKVLVCGNNERNPFSVQMGTITDLYIQGGHFPNRSLQMSLNTVGGSSGSPIISEKDGTVVALNYGSTESAAFGLPIAYVQDALQYVQKGHTPPRYNPGILPVLYALDDAVKFFNFPPALMHEYRAAFPEARSRIPVLLSILPGSSADGLLQEGDVIWEVGGQKIGPDLYEMDRIFNKNGSKPLPITVIRNGQVKIIEVIPENLEPHRIQRILSFAGTYFYQPDDYVRKNFDVSAPHGKSGLFLSWGQPSSPFTALFTPIPFNEKIHNYIEIMTIDGQPVHDLDTLIDMVPHLVAKKNFPVTYVNHFTNVTVNGEPLPSRRKMVEVIEYTDAQAPPFIASYDPETMIWKVHEVMPEEATDKMPPAPEAMLAPQGRDAA